MPSQDAFYVLPDCLLSFILSKIPIKDAVKCCILSRRWRFLHTHMPALSFSPDDFQSIDPLTMSKAENIITSILLLHSSDLEALSIHTDGREWSFSYENLCELVSYAARCNVQQLTLYGTGTLYYNNLKELPTALFSYSHLRTLCLTRYVLTNFLINFVGFPRLISCELKDAEFTNESLVSLISLCPLLQKLEITGGSHLGDVEIVSSSIEHLSMYVVKTLSVHCPKLKTLSVYYFENLCVNGVRFYELSRGIFDLEMDCGDTLRVLSFCGELLFISASRFFDIVGNFHSLEELYVDLPYSYVGQEERDIPLLNLLNRLPNLRYLSISGYFLEDMTRYSVPECLASPHVNLKKINLHFLMFAHEEVALISCLLQSTPFLEQMKIQLPPCRDKNYKSQCMFFKDILYLKRASTLARIVVNF